MSWGVPAPASGELAAAADSSSRANAAEPLLCFACSRCEYPICTSKDLILSRVPGGTTEYAFHYDLEDLLDLEEDVPVPCYCGDETVDTAILLSEDILEEPLPPAAKVMCMESIVESRKHLRSQQTATLAKLMRHRKDGKKSGRASAAADATAATGTEAPGPQSQQTGGGEAMGHGRGVEQQASTRHGSMASLGHLPQAATDEPALGPEHDLQLADSIPEHGDTGGGRPTATTTTAAPSPPPQVRTRSGGDAGREAAQAARVREMLIASYAQRPLRRYGATSEARVDMVGLTTDVLGWGLAISTRDRSAVGIPADLGSEGSREGGGQTESVAARLPQHILDVASRAPRKTTWGPPGNLTVEESFMVVTRSTSSAQGQWFAKFLCEDRVECPDCHLPLGFLFQRRGQGTREGRGASAKHADVDGGGGGDGDEAEGQPEDSAPTTTIQRDFRLPPGRVPVFASLEGERLRSRLTAAQTADGDGEEEEEEEGGSRRSASAHGALPLQQQQQQPRRPRSSGGSGGDDDDDDDGGGGGQTESVAGGAPASDGGLRGVGRGATTRTAGGDGEQKKRVKTERSVGEGGEGEEGEGEGGGGGEEEEAGASDRDEATKAAEEEAFPGEFIGLELKRIKQIAWGLREFQERYTKAQSLHSFRSLFPEAEELQSLYNRLSALRTQSELYNNLLRKHKEQNDVQSSLLHSQKERLGNYEEKMKTLQQILNAQKTQLEMQGTQMKQQDELMRSYRQRVATQAQQIEVEQMLLAEQTKTIESQREQIRLMHAHLEVQLDHARMTARQSQLESEEGKGESEGEDEDDTESPSDQRRATPTPGNDRYGEAVRHTREALAVATRALVGRIATAEARVSACAASPETSSRRTTPSPTQPPAHLRGVYGVPRVLTSSRAAPQEGEGVSKESSDA